jgi:enoyl-[acyl-carrier protein] reductase I
MNKNKTSPLYESQLLKGKAGLIVGIANEESIAYSCGRHFRGQGAKLAIT